MDSHTLQLLLEHEGRVNSKNFKAGINLIYSKDNFDFIQQIEFVDCTFSDGFQLKGLNSDCWVSFSNCVFQRLTLVTETKMKCLEFNNCQFKGHLQITSCEMKKFHFSECETLHRSTISSIKCAFATVVWSNEEIRSSLFIKSKEIDYLQVISKSKEISLTLDDVRRAEILGNYKLIDFYGSNFEFVRITDLKPDPKHNPTLVFNRIVRFRQVDQICTGKIVIEGVEIDQINLSNVESTGSMNLLDLKIQSAFFEDVNIKAFYWNQVEIKDNFWIHRGDFSRIVMSNVEWPDKQKRLTTSVLDQKAPKFYELRKRWLKEHFSKEDLIVMRQERETYRQLKSAAITNNNNVEALQFYKNEMMILWKEIRFNGGYPFWDRVLIFVNRWVSNFGQSWTLPLTLLFTFHSLFYLLLIGFNFSCSKQAISDGIGEYFLLLNPVHKTPENINGFKVAIEFFMRITDGFLIYHFVRATRKFSKF